LLRSAYQGAQFAGEIHLDELSSQLGRLKSNVCRKARQLGLTDNSRKYVAAWKCARKTKDAAELSALISAIAKERIAKNGHPRGMAGKKHSAATKAAISKKSIAYQANLSDDEEAILREKAMRTCVERHGRVAPNVRRGSWKADWREIGGSRKYYRSRWEANYARYLQWLKERGLIQDWQHEPETFWFENIKRGVRSYLPDFKVWENDGSWLLYEVKGWMDARSKTTIARMGRYYPGIKLVVVDAKAYKATARICSHLISDWERGSKGEV
jgi:hypothetical protein